MAALGTVSRRRGVELGMLGCQSSHEPLQGRETSQTATSALIAGTGTNLSKHIQVL